MAVADVFVRVVGSGAWQVAVIVALSMAVAVLLSGGPLIVTQAAVQSVVVVTLLPQPEAGFNRWLDALIGGGVALAAAAVAPQTPLRRPRLEAARVLDELAVVLQDVAAAARAHDVERTEVTLQKARDTEKALEDLRAAAAEGLDVVRSSPFRRRQRAHVERVAEIAEPIDRAVRNSRVLVRRVAAALRYGEQVPPAYLDLVDDLAEVSGRCPTPWRRAARPPTCGPRWSGSPGRPRPPARRRRCPPRWSSHRCARWWSTCSSCTGLDPDAGAGPGAAAGVLTDRR